MHIDHTVSQRKADVQRGLWFVSVGRNHIVGCFGHGRREQHLLSHHRKRHLEIEFLAYDVKRHEPVAGCHASLASKEFLIGRKSRFTDRIGFLLFGPVLFLSFIAGFARLGTQQRGY